MWSFFYHKRFHSIDWIYFSSGIECRTHLGIRTEKKKTFVFVKVKGHLQPKSKFYTMHLHKGNLCSVCTSRKSSKLNLNLYLKKSSNFMVIFLFFSCILKDPYTLSHQTQLLYICFWNWIDKVQQKVIKYRTVCYC